MNKMLRLSVLTIASLFSVNSLASTTCPIEHAHYVYTDGLGVADFTVIDKPDDFRSGLVMHLSFKDKEKRDFWFLFDQGNSRSISLITTSDPAAAGWTRPDPDKHDNHLIPNQMYYSWNSDMKIGIHEPEPGDPAPEFIFVPALPNALEASFRDRIYIGAGIFKRARCA